ncbi:hypothetical protein J4477_02740 [Candidatus Pacearchaeota archaeon]|nr:hypothetical protein [Candidatus Pacearchaeota archaeon]
MGLFKLLRLQDRETGEEEIDFRKYVDGLSEEDFGRLYDVVKDRQFREEVSENRQRRNYMNSMRLRRYFK